MPDQRLLVTCPCLQLLRRGGLLLANFNRQTKANAVHREDASGMYTGGVVIEHPSVA